MQAEALPGSLDLHCRYFSAIAAAGQVCLRSPVMFISRFRRKISTAMYAVARPNVHWQAHAVAVPQVHARKWDWF